MTVKEFRDGLNYLCERGYGDKTVMVANDEEWNGVHYLTEAYVCEQDLLNDLCNWINIPPGTDLNNIVVVG